MGKWVKTHTDIILQALSLSSIATGLYLYDPRISLIVMGVVSFLIAELAPTTKE